MQQQQPINKPRVIVDSHTAIAKINKIIINKIIIPLPDSKRLSFIFKPRLTKRHFILELLFELFTNIPNLNVKRRNALIKL